MTQISYLKLAFVCALAVGLAGCEESATRSPDTVETSQRAPKRTPIPVATPQPSASPTPAETVALIYSGSGATPSGVTSIGEILRSRGLKFEYADHHVFNSMSLAALTKYSIIIFPGGDSNVMDAALTGATKLKVKQAVVTYGVNYTGFCAGAWMAVGPSQAITATPYWGFGFIAGPYLKQYYPNGQNPESAMISTKFASGETRQIVWWRGPILPELSGGVTARYPDGSPAFVGTWAGKGYVTLTGPHPEAPQSWFFGLSDYDGLDYDIAWRTIESALSKRALATY